MITAFDPEIGPKLLEFLRRHGITVPEMYELRIVFRWDSSIRLEIDSHAQAPLIKELLGIVPNGT